MKWKVLDTGLGRADRIMEQDKALLDGLSNEKHPILHLYEFEENSATIGHFLQPEDFFNMQEVEKRGVQIAKRPTGGGIIFHLWDFAFSALIPASHPSFSLNTLENYATINRAVLAAIEEFLQKTGGELTPQDGDILTPSCAHFCMAKPTKYDVLFEGKKVAGAAQRRTRAGLLHQGSISLVLPSKEFLESILRPEVAVLEGMLTFTFPLLGESASLKQQDECREEIKALLRKHLTKDFL
jgi:lipoate-protein ligase A